MNRALWFLLCCSVKNRLRLRLQRLRNPRYLISALAGLAYLYFAFLRHVLWRRPEVSPSASFADPNSAAFLELFCACLLAALVIFQFFFSHLRAPLFSAPEVHFLFSAPLSKAAVMDYRLAKAQMGIVFSALISGIIFARGRLFPKPLFLLITVWAVYSLLYLYRTAVVLAKQRAFFRGSRGRRLRYLAAGCIFLTGVFLTVSGSWFYPAPPSSRSGMNAESWIHWVRTVASSGPVCIVLAPFRAAIRPAFAADLPDFMLRILPVIAGIILLHLWVRTVPAGFDLSLVGQSGEETAAPHSGKAAPLEPTWRKRRQPFALHPEGFPPLAICWKNLLLSGGLSLSRMALALMVLSFVLIPTALALGAQVQRIMGSVCAAMAGFMALMGPVILRDDLRTDLPHIDQLKTYPVPGWGIVLGEVLGPATVLTLRIWGLVWVAACLLPGLEMQPWTWSQRAFIGISAALLLPCLGIIGILVQNAAALLLPGWVQLGREHRQGVEAMGLRLIASIATIVSLALAAIPGGLLFLGVWLAGHWLLGLAVAPIASAIAGLGLLVEGAVAILWLGRLFDRLDPATLSSEA